LFKQRSIFECKNDHDLEYFEIWSVSPRDIVVCCFCSILHLLRLIMHCRILREVEELFSSTVSVILWLIPSLHLIEACLLEVGEELFDVAPNVEHV